MQTSRLAMQHILKISIKLLKKNLLEIENVETWPVYLVPTRGRNMVQMHLVPTRETRRPGHSAALLIAPYASALAMSRGRLQIGPNLQTWT